MRKTLPATITIDADALAGLASGNTPDTTALLERVVGLLADVRSRLDADSSLLVDQKTAAKLLSCSTQSLKNWHIPHIPTAGRRLYRRAALIEWAKEHETSSEAAEVAK
jgi:hypothetical protein